MLGRKKFMKSRLNQTQMHHESMAAKKIQNTYRKRYQPHIIKKKAVLKIQGSFRVFMHHKREKQEEEIKQIEENQMRARNASAIVIQKYLRGIYARQQVQVSFTLFFSLSLFYFISRKSLL